jgi:hypothetical protein
MCCAVHRWLQTCAWALRSSALCVERLRFVRCPRVLDHDLYTLGQYRQLRLLVLDHCVSLSDEASGMMMMIIIIITIIITTTIIIITVPRRTSPSRPTPFLS